ncbi:1-phosphofructokinase family hexose kinase [Mycobacterium sp. WMMD1722]|uniref:1-phosphofructokinase family hexose kinase n=1 Tax=Mycobacterium sp. WMMD1722 TaxID=3404117 RepID=UPI003BF53E35
MILTVTPNPSVDRTVLLDRLIPGAVNRSTRSWSEPSGKGVNVSLALSSNGTASHAVLPAGGASGAQLRQMLAAAGLPVTYVPIEGSIRSNISLAQADGVVTKINETGPQLHAAEIDALIDAVVAHLDGAQWLVCAGSLPAGAPDNLYARLCEHAHRHAVAVAVDSSGAPLASCLAAEPTVIKPNTGELAQLTGTSPGTLGEVLAAAEEVRRRGAGAVLASLGAEGAVLVDADGVLHGRAVVNRVVSTVGAGDALLAGYLSAARRPREQQLAAALQWAAAAVGHEGTLFQLGASPAQITLTDAPDLSLPVAATL